MPGDPFKKPAARQSPRPKPSRGSFSAGGPGGMTTPPSGAAATKRASALPRQPKKVTTSAKTTPRSMPSVPKVPRPQ